MSKLARISLILFGLKYDHHMSTLNLMEVFHRSISDKHILKHTKAIKNENT